MLSKADNELLTATGGRGTDGAALPPLLAARIALARAAGERRAAGPSAAPKRRARGVRDSSGHVALTDGVCPHRGANLFYGRNEAGGIRCIFHGWKFDVTGACLEMPNVPQDATYERLRAQMNIVAYPTHEIRRRDLGLHGPGRTAAVSAHGVRTRSKRAALRLEETAAVQLGASDGGRARHRALFVLAHVGRRRRSVGRDVAVGSRGERRRVARALAARRRHSAFLDDRSRRRNRTRRRAQSRSRPPLLAHQSVSLAQSRARSEHVSGRELSRSDLHADR